MELKKTEYVFTVLTRSVIKRLGCVPFGKRDMEQVKVR